MLKNADKFTFSAYYMLDKGGCLEIVVSEADDAGMFFLTDYEGAEAQCIELNTLVLTLEQKADISNVIVALQGLFRN